MADEEVPAAVVDDLAVLEGKVEEEVVDFDVIELIVGFAVADVDGIADVIELVMGFAVVDVDGIVDVVLPVIVETSVDLIVLVVVLQAICIFFTEQDEVPNVKVVV